jgi:lysophospholipase L1-like esterase
MNYRVLCFGDSIAYGAWDSEGGWADRLKKSVHQACENGRYPNKYQFYNQSIGGDTSESLLKRIESEITARRSPRWPLLIVIAVGINDSRIDASSGELEVALEKYEENIGKLVQLVKKYTNNIIFVGLTPVLDERTAFKDVIYSNTSIKRYDDVLTRKTEELKLLKVEIYKNAIKNNIFIDSLRTEDGLHPDTVGHQWLYEQIKPILFSKIELKNFLP